MRGVPPSRPSAHSVPFSRLFFFFSHLPVYPADFACKAGPHWGGVYWGAVRTSQSFGKHPFPPPFLLILPLRHFPLSRGHSGRSTSVLITCWADSSTRKVYAESAIHWEEGERHRSDILPLSHGFC